MKAWWLFRLLVILAAVALLVGVAVLGAVILVTALIWEPSMTDRALFGAVGLCAASGACALLSMLAAWAVGGE